MEIRCGNKVLRLKFEKGGMCSMLILGRSRMGKTVCALLLAAYLIYQGYSVHLIDFGMKWSSHDIKMFLAGRVKKHQVSEEGITLYFESVRELIGCAKVILDSIGISAHAAKGVLDKVFSHLCKSQNGSFYMEDILNKLKEMEEEGAEGQWAERLIARFDSCQEVPEIQFQIDAGFDFCTESVLWDLWGIDDVYVEIITNLVLYCTLCRQKRKIKNDEYSKGTYVILDEIQTMNFNRGSIVGTCLTEGQKYALGLVMISQFLQGNFSDAVINQFNQGGFRFYFRLTEAEARIVSRQLACDCDQQKELFSRLTRLPCGQCLFIGPHSIEGRQEISEALRFVEIKA